MWTRPDSGERYAFATPASIPDIVEMLQDPEVGRWLWFTPGPREFFEQYFAGFIDAQALDIAAGDRPRNSVFTVSAASGEFLGEGAVIEVEGSPDGYEIGFQLRRQAWGRGVGIRLGRFLCAYAIVRCGAYRIEASCLEGNAGSRAILEKLGLSREGRRPGYRLREDVRHTELLYGAQVSELDTAMFLQVGDAVGLTAGR